MAGKVIAKGEFLLAQLIGLVPALRLHGLQYGVGGLVRAPKKTRLTRCTLGLLSSFHGDAHGGQEARAIVEQGIERAGAHQRLDRAPINNAPVATAAKIE